MQGLHWAGQGILGFSRLLALQPHMRAIGVRLLDLLELTVLENWDLDEFLQPLGMALPVCASGPGELGREEPAVVPCSGSTVDMLICLCCPFNTL